MFGSLRTAWTAHRHLEDVFSSRGLKLIRGWRTPRKWMVRSASGALYLAIGSRHWVKTLPNWNSCIVNPFGVGARHLPSCRCTIPSPMSISLLPWNMTISFSSSRMFASLWNRWSVLIILLILVLCVIMILYSNTHNILCLWFTTAKENM